MYAKAKFYNSIILMVTMLFLLCPSACKRAAPDSRENDHPRSPSGRSKTLINLRFRPKWYPQAQFSGVYMARKMGFYEDYGINLNLQDALSDKGALDSLIVGKGDVIHMDLLTALNINRDSTVVVNICQVSQKSSLLLVGRKSRGIRSLQDFQGKKLGIWRSGPNLVTRTYLDDHDIKMEIIPIDWSINLFTANVVDVINVMQYNEYHQLLQAGIPEEDLFVLPLDTAGYDIPDEGFYVTPGFYQANPKLCQDFAEATMDGWTYAITHQEETIEEVLRIMQEAKIRANKAQQTWMLSEMKKAVMAQPTTFGKLSKADYLNAHSIMKRTGKQSRDIPYEEFYPRAKQ